MEIFEPVAIVPHLIMQQDNKKTKKKRLPKADRSLLTKTILLTIPLENHGNIINKYAIRFFFYYIYYFFSQTTYAYE